MNTILLFLIAVPAIEIYVMIKIGQNIGAFSTVALIFATAFIGIFFAKIEGLNTLRSGVYNLYKNKIPLFEMISGATIALAAILLIVPGFITDFFGFLLLFPPTRRLIISSFLKKNNPIKNYHDDIIEGETLDKDQKAERLATFEVYYPDSTLAEEVQIPGIKVDKQLIKDNLAVPTDRHQFRVYKTASNKVKVEAGNFVWLNGPSPKLVSKEVE